MNLREFVERASERAEFLFRKDGYLSPIWHAVRRDGTSFVMPQPAEDKDTAVALMSALFDIEDVVRFVFMDEAWILTSDDAPAEEMMKIARSGGISKHPNKREILMLAAEDEREGMLMGRRLITRQGKRATLGPLVIDEGGIGEGRLVGLLRRGREQ